MAVKWCGCDEALYQQALALEELAMNSTRERFASSHRNNPTSTPEFSRVCVVNGEVVSHVRIYERDYRIGTTPVPGAGIGDVCTHPEKRHRGYGAGCLRDSIDYFQEHGQHLSMILSGVFGFYLSEKWEKFPQHTYAVPVGLRAPRAKKGTYAVRWFERDTDDLEQVMDVYDAYSRNKSLSVVRTALYWRRRLRWQAGDSPESFLVAERAGRIVGYVRGNGAEMCMLPEERDSALALYDALVRSNRKRQQERVRLRVPGDNPLFPVVEGNPKVEKHTSMGCLLRFIDLQAVFATILDELQLRWLRSGVRWEGAFLFKAKGVRQSAALTIADRELSLSASAAGRPVVLSWTQADLFKLLTGYGTLEELPLEGVDKQAGKALAALFPRGDVVFWHTDTV